MSNTSRALIALVPMLALMGCSGGAPVASPTPSATTPAVRSMVVTIADAVPLAVYFNLDNVKCTAQRYGGAKVTRGPEVAVLDGTGAIIATQDAPLEGGARTGQGCEVQVKFTDVRASDVYVVRVKAATGEAFERTVSAAAASKEIRVDV